MDNRAKLAVLITYHDEGALLTECLESLRRQIAPVDEILIYDDASSYPAKDYVPDGVTAQIIRGEVNRGPSCGRNVLLHQSRSDLIHFQDSDDLFHPLWSLRVSEQFATHEIEAVFTEVSFFSEDGTPSSERVLGLKTIGGGSDLVLFCLRGSMLPACGSYRRSAVLSIGGYRESLWQSEDFDFHIRLAASGIRYRVIDEPLVLCRSRSTGRSQNRLEVYACALQAVEMLSHELSAEYRPDLAARAAQIGSVLFRLGLQEEARGAFRLADSLGPPDLSGQRLLYRTVGRAFGLEAAEKGGAWYRRAVPHGIRRVFAGRGL